MQRLADAPLQEMAQLEEPGGERTLRELGPIRYATHEQRSAMFREHEPTQQYLPDYDVCRELMMQVR